MKKVRSVLGNKPTQTVTWLPVHASRYIVAATVSAIILTANAKRTADYSGEHPAYKRNMSAVEYFEQLQVGPPRRVPHDELQQFASLVFDAAQWTALHPKTNRPVEESCPLYQLLAANLPTFATLYDRFDVRLDNIRFELETLGFRASEEMTPERETIERRKSESNHVNRYKGFASGVAYVEQLSVEPTGPVSNDRLAELADIIFEAARWTGQNPAYDFRINQSCPIFRSLAANLAPIAALPEHLDVRLRHLSVKLEELGFREKRKRLLIEPK
jgi:hypothetical protein